jgi:hypothetical protein
VLEQRVAREGLGDVADGAGLDALGQRLPARRAGQHQHRDAGQARQAGDHPGERHAVEIGQVDVHQDHVRLLAADGADEGGAVGQRHQLEAAVVRGGGDQLALDLVVLHDPQRAGGGEKLRASARTRVAIDSSLPLAWTGQAAPSSKAFEPCGRPAGRRRAGATSFSKKVCTPSTCRAEVVGGARQSRWPSDFWICSKASTTTCGSGASKSVAAGLAVCRP